MFRVFVPLSLALCALTEDPPQPEARQLADLLRASSKIESLHLAGSISEHAVENDAFAGAIVVGAGASKPYTGEIDAWRTAAGELFVMSKARVPEFAYFDDGAQSIVRTTWCDEAPDVSQAIADLTGVLDLDGVANAIAKAKIACAKTDAGSTYSCELPSRIIPRGEGIAAFARPKVLRVEARFTTDAAGVLKMMRCTVVRTDPLAQIRRNALENGGANVTATGADFSDEEGASSVYEFSLGTDAPAGRAAAAMQSLRETLQGHAR